ncbi:hypothetical protein EV694_2184 [Volucribacter psittacicida]|uniref:Uncharacterized protein n=1 Tax=Volucribacter psittacicida TaxID=203482 RepID=A0A4R1FIV2_9PAST|nr:hypothetical protein [Volucribacter psittacicida]TCJ93950.1 hypothetical protein EV694_2184 [Volucribacter psittacicida]
MNKYIKKLLKNRVFISETNLSNIIKNSKIYEINNDDLDTEYLTDEEVNTIIKNIDILIDKESKKLVKIIKSKLEIINKNIIYSNLQDKLWYQSALITEIFRHYSISKNSASINAHIIQKKIYCAIIKGNIHFSIGWGQAKRSCGHLKTEGYCADFSELYAIIVLYTILKTIHVICSKKVTLTVLTGGSRFYPALFTNPNSNLFYNKQRQAMANIFSNENYLITFEDYNDFYNIDMNIDKINKLANEIDHSFAYKIMDYILLNVDWHYVISNYKDINLEITENFLSYLKQDSSNIDKVIKIATISILNRKSQAYWIRKLGNLKLFDDIIDFFYNFSISSSKKYIAIHLLNLKDSIISHDRIDIEKVRLTVHEKKDRNDIPAIFTLGINAGNKLSQHVCSFVDTQEIKFTTLFELIQSKYQNNVNIKRVIPPRNSCLYWLYEQKQPLFYTSLNKESYIKKLSNMKIIDG